VVAYTYNLRYIGSRGRGIAVRGQSRQKFLRHPPISINGWARWHAPAISTMQGSTNRRFSFQVSPGIKQDPVSKISNAKRTGRKAKVVEYLS
jgi:hypothetical protein